jgi:hypothetical protein
MFATYLYFRVFGCANLFKLASASQFAETDQNSQHGQDASRSGTGQAGRTASHFLSGARRKWTRMDRLHRRDASARWRCPYALMKIMKKI